MPSFAITHCHSVFTGENFGIFNIAYLVFTTPSHGQRKTLLYILIVWNNCRELINYFYTLEAYTIIF
jgi:hypothetical protein